MGCSPGTDTCMHDFFPVWAVPPASAAAAGACGCCCRCTPRSARCPTAKSRAACSCATSGWCPLCSVAVLCCTRHRSFAGMQPACLHSFVHSCVLVGPECPQCMLHIMALLPHAASQRSRMGAKASLPGHVLTPTPHQLMCPASACHACRRRQATRQEDKRRAAYRTMLRQQMGA